MAHQVAEGSETSDVALAERVQTARDAMLRSLRVRIVGQDDIIEQALIALFAGGHALIVGVPGLAKTLLVQSLSDTLGMRFSRIQFTPDLMPSDITGTDIIQEDPDTGRRGMTFVPGPIFANVVLADEINRTPPKTQAALLEAMQERRVTVQGRTYPLYPPFHVFATQNPIELEGTYPLPEAQLDRFMFQIVIDYLSEDDEVAVVRQTTANRDDAIPPVVHTDELVRYQRLVRDVAVSEPVARYAVAIARASRPTSSTAPAPVKDYLSYGASVRAAQFLTLGGKARALLHGRLHVTVDDVRALALPVLRHRLLLNFRAQSERMTTSRIIEQILAHVPRPTSGM